MLNIIFYSTGSNALKFLKGKRREELYFMNNDKKVTYVKIGDESVSEKKKKKKRVRSFDVYEKPTPGQIVIKSLGIIGTTISAMLLVLGLLIILVIHRFYSFHGF